MSVRVQAERSTRRWGGALLGMMVMLLLWGAILGLVGLGVWTMARRGQHRVGHGMGSDALDIAREAPAEQAAPIHEAYGEARQELEE